MEPVWNFLLFTDVGLEPFIKLHFRVGDCYRVTREPARSDELVDG